MRPLAVLFCLALLAVSLTGCGPSSAGSGTPAPALPSPQSTAAWQQVDSLDYLNWKKFPVGTVVVRTAVTTNGDTTVTSVETFTLKTATATEATVERQNTTFRSDGSYNKVNEPDLRKYHAKLPVHPDLDPNDFLKPDRKAKRAGTEKVNVLGTEYECVRWEWTNGTEAGPMTVVSWLCEEVPGRIAKQEMKVAAINSTTVEVVSEWKKPK